MLAFGQTHRPYIDLARRPILLNPGSVGQSRLSAGVASAAHLNSEKMEIRLLQYEYNTCDVIALAKKNGAGDWISKFLV